MTLKKRQGSVTMMLLSLWGSVYLSGFLGAEYLYVDVLSRIVSEDKTVLAQNYALGVSDGGISFVSVV